MEMNEKVSVIIPMYNAARYIERCIRSILQQTYSSIELILVDDGSTDDTFKVAQKSFEKDKRVCIYTQPNGGVSKARNFGLSFSTGSYVIFVDADDYLDLEMIETMVATIADKFDMAICGFRRCFETTTEKVYNSTNKVVDYEIIMSPKEIANNYWRLQEIGCINPPWNKIYRMSVIKDNNILFLESSTWGEDCIFNLSYISKSKEIKLMKKVLYNYVIHPNQATKKIDKGYFDRVSRNFSVIEDFIDYHDGFSNKDNALKHDMAKLKVIKQACFGVVCEHHKFHSKMKQLKQIASSEFSQFHYSSKEILNFYYRLLYNAIKDQNIYMLYLLAKINCVVSRLKRE